MKSVFTVMLLLCASFGCSSLKEPGNGLPEQYITLKVPLDSEEGQVALSCIRYWSELYKADTKKLLFVPLSEKQIANVSPPFGRHLAPGSRAELRKRLYTQVVDRSNGQKGTAVGIFRVTVSTDNEAMVVLETMSNIGNSVGKYGYIVNLIKTNADWQVGNYTNVYAPGIYHWKLAN